jgi:hypothetical protein
MSPLVLAAAAGALVAHTPVGDIYAHDVPGSSFRAIEIHGKLQAPAWAVREVVLSPSATYGLTPYLAEERIVGTDQCTPGASRIPGCRVHWLYTLVKPPFVAPRDYTVRVDLLHDELLAGGTFELKWDIAPDHGPPPPAGAVRLLANAGGWLIEATGNVTQFVYRIFNDPGGNIPAWMVNAGNEREIPRMLAAVETAAKELAAKRAAQSATQAAHEP